MDGRWTTVTLAADAARPHDEALRWIAAHAAGIERIRVIGVDPAADGPAGPDGRPAVDVVAEAARAVVPGAEVEVRRHAGPFTNALVAESDVSDLLVIGSWRSRRGSTAGGDPARIAARASVPTVVVPDVPHPIDGDVVLAVEEPLDEHAVRVAVDEAARRNRRLTVLRAWEMPVLTRTGLTEFVEDPLRWRTGNAALLERVTATLRERHPGLRVRPLLVEGHPGRAIADHTRTACLVVLGRGHVHALSGSVLHDLLRATVSPVCVVPPTAHEGGRAVDDPAGRADRADRTGRAEDAQPASDRTAEATRPLR